MGGVRPMLVCARDPAWGGGVAEVARLMVAHRPGARFVRIGRSPGGAAAAVASPRRLRRAIRATGSPVVLLNPSLRTGSLVRDLILARVAVAEGARVVLWVHGASAAWLARARRSAVRRALRTALRGVHALLVLTPEQHAVLQGLGPPVHRITAAWDPTLLAEGPARPGADAPWLFLGRLTHAKGVWTLARAAAAVPGLRVDLAGRGPEAARLDAWIAAHRLGTRIRRVGWLEASAKRAALRRAAGLVLPSTSEGCPVCVLEAMAVGLPVVATAVGALPELAPGPLVAVGDEGALADALHQLSHDPASRARLGADNAIRAQAWSAPAVARRLDALVSA